MLGGLFTWDSGLYRWRRGLSISIYSLIPSDHRCHVPSCSSLISPHKGLCLALEAKINPSSGRLCQSTLKQKLRQSLKWEQFLFLPFRRRIKHMKMEQSCTQADYKQSVQNLPCWEIGNELCLWHSTRPPAPSVLFSGFSSPNGHYLCLIPLSRSSWCADLRQQHGSTPVSLWAEPRPRGQTA